jgi:hypothetical protein
MFCVIVPLSGNILYGMTPMGGTGLNGLIFRFKDPDLGIDKLSESTGTIGIYPNPSSGIFTIQSSVASARMSVEIFNVLGAKVYSNSRQPMANSQQLITIDLASQPNGIYFYRLINEDGSVAGSGKLIIQK